MLPAYVMEEKPGPLDRLAMNNEWIFYTDMLMWATALRIAHPLPKSLQAEGGEEAAAAASVRAS
eukprot:2518701-Pleurochrysis_carterae.AAC.1